MRTDPSFRRQQTYLAGHRAERVALLWLAIRGYRILARRYQVHGGEIDLVARRGETVAFVEVKTRPTRDEALQALTEVKRRRIERAAAVWLTRNSWATSCVLRGDAILVTSRRLPLHVKAAFDLHIG